MPAPCRRALAASAALAAALGTPLPALAAAGPGLVRAPMVATSPHLTGPHGPVAQGTSTNWSGYAATGAKFTSVSASWVQPAGQCGSTDTWSSFWVGLDGDGSDSVEQTGSEVDCSGGSPQYYSWYEMYPAYPVSYNDPVAAGDHFTASVTESGSGSFTLKLSDTTQGWSHTIHKTLHNPALASAEIIAEAPSTASGPLPLTDFGQVQFSDASANGKPIGSFDPENITMAEHDGTTLATTSALTTQNAFSVAWQHS
ncbi:G1 family endopeptidase [Kitasatospora sp. NBC_01287]|uniref:G1 family glutamic endopeptidase n=1 Tax=Kitasatospora sp. NBC_01287 TaxID=2903573 RepID=UPI00225C041E|nr:G1 family glutamic endopeptidase [Kitasatospora sp. NBC_01287]MCX4750651.1 G1 family endopeptidase [Kitasatospora sp. NBC_01287]